MKKMCCIIFGKYRKFKNQKTSIIFEKTLVFSIIYSNCGNDAETASREEERNQLKY